MLLAGGKSKRMGIPKGLLRYKNTFWILEQLNSISKTDISEVYVGLGHDHQVYFEAIPWFETAQRKFVKYIHLNVKIIVNPTPENGSFSTLQSVLGSFTNTDVIINPIDVPLLNSNEFKQIHAADNAVTIPNYKGKNGHPIKLAAAFCESLLILDNKEDTARLDLQIKKLNPEKITKVKISDPSILKNLNNRENWNSFLNQAQISPNFSDK